MERRLVDLITVERRQQSTRTKTCIARLLCTRTAPTCEDTAWNLHHIQSHHTPSPLHLPERRWLVALNRTFGDLGTAYVLGGSKNGRFNWHGSATITNSTRSIQLDLPEPTCLNALPPYRCLPAKTSNTAHVTRTISNSMSVRHDIKRSEDD